MGKRIEVMGERFGRLVVIGEAANRNEKRYLVAQCDCGSMKEVGLAVMRKGEALSCGCLRREVTSKAMTTHGLANKCSEYRIWKIMIQRCSNPNFSTYSNYGGRGIKVCPEWRFSFETFYQDVGPRPSSRHSLERIDNESGYSASNVKWATKYEQSRNKRTNVFIEYEGIRMCLEDWATRFGIHSSTIGQRLRSGWSYEEAFTIPVGGKRCRTGT